MSFLNFVNFVEDLDNLITFETLVDLQSFLVLETSITFIGCLTLLDLNFFVILEPFAMRINFGSLAVLVKLNTIDGGDVHFPVKYWSKLKSVGKGLAASVGASLNNFES